MWCIKKTALQPGDLQEIRFDTSFSQIDITILLVWYVIIFVVDSRVGSRSSLLFIIYLYDYTSLRSWHRVWWRIINFISRNRQVLFCQKQLTSFFVYLFIFYQKQEIVSNNIIINIILAHLLSPKGILFYAMLIFRRR